MISKLKISGQEFTPDDKNPTCIDQEVLNVLLFDGFFAWYLNVESRKKSLIKDIFPHFDITYSFIKSLLRSENSHNNKHSFPICFKFLFFNHFFYNISMFKPHLSHVISNAEIISLSVSKLHHISSLTSQM